MLTAISWARESNQYDKNEYTLDAQIEANRRNAERDGLTISHTFREKWSGVDLWAMPQLTRLRSLLQATPGKKIIYVYAQDRLVRGEEGEDIFWLLVEFRRYQAEVRFHLNPVDLTSIAGKIQVLIAGNEAANEIGKIVDRTWTRGRLKRMQSGKIPNSGPEKYGFRRIRETGKAEIVPEQAAVIRRAAALVEEGWGLYHIAQQFNREQIPTVSGKPWFSQTIRRWFVDPAYKGEGYGWKWSRPKNGQLRARQPSEQIKLAADAFPPIIEPALWDRLHQKLTQNKGIRARQERYFVLLRGLLVCGQCGFSAYFSRANDRKGGQPYEFYQCGRYSQDAHAQRPRQCHARTRRARELETEIWSQVAGLLSHSDRLQSLLASAAPVDRQARQEELDALTRAGESKLTEIKRLTARLRTASDLIAGHIEQELATVESERRVIERQVVEFRAALAEQDARHAHLLSLAELATQIADRLDTAPPEIQRQILEALPFRYTLQGEILL